MTNMNMIDSPRGAPAAGDAPRIWRVWYRRLTEADIMPRGLIRQWTTHIVPLSLGYPGGGFRSNLTTGWAAHLGEIFHHEVATRDVYRLEPSHVRFGLEWLKSNLPKVADRFNLPDDFHTFDQIDVDDPFRFVGVHEDWSHNQWGKYPVVEGGGYGNRPYMSPLYEVRYYRPGGDLSHWSYHWEPWTERARRR